MFVLIERYMNNMSIHDFNNLAISKGIGLSKEELEFAYSFVIKNWKTVLSNHGVFDLEKYKDKFSEENFVKIRNLIKDMKIKYNKYL